MIVLKFGNVLDSKAHIIFHQVNCQGKMNAGLGKQIRNICPQHYTDYMTMINKHDKDNLLGRWVDTRWRDYQIISGIFAQYYYGHEGCYTNYYALQRALLYHKIYASLRGINLFAVPYGIGCGLAGGDWSTVMSILENLFSDDTINLEIWRMTS